MISNPTTQAQKQQNFDEGYNSGYWNAWYGTIPQSNAVQYPIDYHEGYCAGYAQGKDERERWVNRNCA